MADTSPTSERLTRPAAAEQADSAGSSTQPYATPLSSVQDVLRASSGVAELELIRNWLGAHLGSALHPVEVRKGYRPFTRNRLRAEKRVGGTRGGRAGSSLGMGSAGGRKERDRALDPDAGGEEKEDVVSALHES